MADRVTIRFISGTLSGQTFSIGLGELFYIGSGSDCNAVIAGDPTVAEKHVAIYYRAPGKVLIKDLNSSVGSKKNGKTLAKTSKLRTGDRITVGVATTFQCSVWDPLQASRMTGLLKGRNSSMSRIGSRRSPQESFLGDFTWRPGNRVKTVTIGIMTGSLLALLVFSLIGILDQKFQRTSPGLRMSALKPVEQATVQASAAPKSESFDKTFIWDEIVNLSTRFGETPPSAMDDAFISKVQYWISRFTTRGYHRELLKRRENYIDVIDAALKEQNLPLELGYLVWVESAYETQALSSAGARGLWQLMPATAREYGLRVDLSKKIDERIDPVKSSRAAAAYLTLLLKMFGSQRYLLAIASYNTGQNRVKRFQIASTIKRSRSPDFWHLAGQLPAETVDYVPKFLAAVIVARNPGRF